MSSRKRSQFKSICGHGITDVRLKLVLVDIHGHTVLMEFVFKFSSEGTVLIQNTVRSTGFMIENGGDAGNQKIKTHEKFTNRGTIVKFVCIDICKHMHEEV